MDELLRETLRLVYSSTRPMPAHFTQNGDRKQSFCIDFEPLKADDDYEMASVSWYSISDFLGLDKCGDEKLSKSQLNIVTRCGEDLMFGAFILSKLGGILLAVDMKNEIIDNTIESFGNKIENLKNIIYGKQVNKYFDYCIKFGHDRSVSN